jgi:nucleoside-diphosphate-sugar epimerase
MGKRSGTVGKVAPKRILVVGGSGFIGSHVLLESISRGWQVCSLSLRKPDPEFCLPGVDYLAADVIDKENLVEQIGDRKFEFVVNLGGYIDHRPFGQGGGLAFGAHFFSVKNLINVINPQALERFVEVGSSDEYGDHSAPQKESMRERPISPYALGKTAATHLLQMSQRTQGFPGIILRFFLVYGPRQQINRFLPQIICGCLERKNIPVSEGKQRRDFCFIDDVVQAIFLALETPGIEGEIFNIGSGVSVTIREVIEMVRSKIGSGSPDYGEFHYRAGENMNLVADVTKAKEQLGWFATVPLGAGLDETISWYREHVPSP